MIIINYLMINIESGLIRAILLSNTSLIIDIINDYYEKWADLSKISDKQTKIFEQVVIIEQQLIKKINSFESNKNQR